mgnify:FL=1
MSITEKLLNLISRPAPSVNPLAPIPSPTPIPPGCQGVWSEIAASGGGFYAAFTVVSNRSGRLSDTVDSFCDGSNPSGLGQIMNIMRDLLCALAYIENALGFTFPDWSPLRNLYNAVNTLSDFSNRTSKGPPTAEDHVIFCQNFNSYLIHWFLMGGAGEWMDHLDLSPDSNWQACPEVNDNWVRDHLNQYDEIQGIVLEVVLSTLLALSAAIAATLAAAALIGPAAVASAIAAATSAIQSALAWLIGQQAAATVAAGFVAAISTTCIADDTDTGVEKPTSGGGCCVNGEVVDEIEDQESCYATNGLWLDDTSKGCPIQEQK